MRTAPMKPEEGQRSLFGMFFMRLPGYRELDTRIQRREEG
jgi:hypothetical protein